MNKTLLCLLACACVFFAAGCESQEKKDQAMLTKIQQTVIPDCGSKTFGDLASGLLESPVWTLQKSDPKTPTHVEVQGTLAGDKLPEMVKTWVKEQKLMDITFKFALNPATGAFDPAVLDGFPDPTHPEFLFQTYKKLSCL